MGNLTVPLNKSAVWPCTESCVNHPLSKRLSAELEGTQSKPWEYGKSFEHVERYKSLKLFNSGSGDEKHDIIIKIKSATEYLLSLSIRRKYI